MNAKTLAGGVTGAVIGAATWYWLATGDPSRETDWVPLLIGALAGLGARIAAEPMLKNWRRGAIVGVIALVTMIATQQGISFALDLNPAWLEVA